MVARSRLSSSSLALTCDWWKLMSISEYGPRKIQSAIATEHTLTSR